MGQQKKIYVTQGEIKIAKPPAVIYTILGSCVAVCLRDKNTGISGMNHYMLPESKFEKPSLKYGDFSTQKLIDTVKAKAGESADLVAKIFGGANVMSSIVSTIGDNNIDMAKKVLKENSIKLVAEGTGGTKHRKIKFDTETGKVKVYSPKESERETLLQDSKADENGKKILIVDNAYKRMQAIRRHMRSLGYSAVVNHGTRYALKRGLDQKVDTIIADSMSAFSENGDICFCLSCKKHELMKSVPIIVFSSPEEPGESNHNKKYADYFIQKVKDEEEILRQIEIILKHIK